MPVLPSEPPLWVRLRISRNDRPAAEIAQTVGITASTLRRYEAGAIPIPDDVLIALALVYDDRTLLERHPVPQALRNWTRLRTVA